MMRSSGGALAVAVALLFAVCHADSHPDQDPEHTPGERFDANGHKAQNVEPGSRSLVRQVRESRSSSLIPQYLFKQYGLVSPYSGKRELWPVTSFTGYNGDGLPKRNFDEIDRSNMNTFVRKRNFDEIDQTNMPFPFATKRFYSLLQSNGLDGPLANYDKASGRRQFDEIDRSNFPIGSKRSMDGLYYDSRAL